MMYYPTPEEGLFVLKTNVEVNVKNKTKSTPKDAIESEENTKMTEKTKLDLDPPIFLVRVLI